MFSKLAAKNVGRSVKDYGVWFLTIVFAVCLFYVFNALETQAVFQYLGSGPTAPTAQAIRELVGMLSVFVWVVLTGIPNREETRRQREAAISAANP